MEILTVLKANIRHKKGSFTGILVLMAIISLALVSILSVWDNIYNGMVSAQERMNTGDVICQIPNIRLDEKLLSNVKNHSLVKEVKAVESLAPLKVTYQDYTYLNTVFVQECNPKARLFNSEGTGFLDKAPEIKPGELYISQGMKTNLSCETGEIIKLTFTSGTYDFKIAGIIEDPELGASIIGWKNIFISHQDFKKLYEESQKTVEADSGVTEVITRLSVYKKDDCNLTDEKFLRQLNLDTSISDMSHGSLTRSSILHYTCLFPQVFSTVLTVFAILLLVSVVVIMCHSVSSGIEMEYTTLGIMKSQGFTKGKIRLTLALQYLLAEFAGIILGTLPAVFLCTAIGNLFFPITGVVPRHAVSVGKCGGILLSVLVISALCIGIVTRKIAKISPVQAISGGKGAVWFDSRLNLAVNKKMLSESLAFRQFTSGKRQYLGVTAIVVILVYFMVSMMVLANAMNKTSTWAAMGIPYSDLDINLSKAVTEAEMKKIEDTIGKYSKFQVSYKDGGHYYFSVNGEQVMGLTPDKPEFILGVSKGRLPRYDNEIVMTEIAADNLDLKLGDKVTIGYRDKKAEYIICGLNQNTNDTGNNFSITRSAASGLCNVDIRYMGYILEDKSKGEKIAEELNKKYEDILMAANDEDNMDDTVTLAITAMSFIVYIFSAVFALVVAVMVCSRAFLRERRDIGIYKSLGFTSANLRLQFALRFFIVAVIGSIIGSGLAAAFAGKMLSTILRVIGISDFQVSFTVLTFILPAAVICMCFFLFSYAASGRIKRVEVRELVTE